ncbi:MAG TPA: D-alanyl-D-alanine carboxypeptidase family protein, partial [Lacunisphaera sp.]|nr:D-alanyl-D-alanine carboxypeptidase family protein [Lacunisphaera sp.]
VRRKLARGETIDAILKVSAAPGCSEHHTGRALDLGAPNHLRLEASFSRTPEYAWLKKHARRFGFLLSYPRRNSHGINYEPWHWCWHQRPPATRGRSHASGTERVPRAGTDGAIHRPS